jgi:hypothetical protein
LFFKHWLKTGSSSITHCLSFFFSGFLQKKHSETQTWDPSTRILQISHWHKKPFTMQNPKSLEGIRTHPQWIRESVISLLPADSSCFQALSLEIISLSRKKFNINANEDPN